MNVRGGVDLSLVAPDKMPGVEENPRHRLRVGFVGGGRGSGVDLLTESSRWLDCVGISLLLLRNRD